MLLNHNFRLFYEFSRGGIVFAFQQHEELHVFQNYTEGATKLKIICSGGYDWCLADQSKATIDASLSETVMQSQY